MRTAATRLHVTYASDLALISKFSAFMKFHEVSDTNQDLFDEQACSMQTADMAPSVSGQDASVYFTADILCTNQTSNTPTRLTSQL